MGVLKTHKKEDCSLQPKKGLLGQDGKETFRRTKTFKYKHNHCASETFRKTNLDKL